MYKTNVRTYQNHPLKISFNDRLESLLIDFCLWLTIQQCNSPLFIASYIGPFMSHYQIQTLLLFLHCHIINLQIKSPDKLKYQCDLGIRFGQVTQRSFRIKQFP